MARKRIERANKTATIAEVFPRFVTSKEAAGGSTETVNMYYSHLNCISKYLDPDTSFEQLTKDVLPTALTAACRH